MAVKRNAPKQETVERVVIVDKESGTVCTVGSNVVDKYVSGPKAKFVLEDDYEPPAEEDEVPPSSSVSPKK